MFGHLAEMIGNKMSEVPETLQSEEQLRESYQQLQAEVERLTEERHKLVAMLFRVRSLTMRRDGLEKIANPVCEILLPYNESEFCEPIAKGEPDDD